MSKEEFLIAYVLNKAKAKPDQLNGDYAAGEAIKAWKVIQLEVLRSSK